MRRGKGMSWREGMSRTKGISRTKGMRRGKGKSVEVRSRGRRLRMRIRIKITFLSECTYITWRSHNYLMSLLTKCKSSNNPLFYFFYNSFVIYWFSCKIGTKSSSLLILCFEIFFLSKSIFLIMYLYEYCQWEKDKNS